VYSLASPAAATPAPTVKLKISSNHGFGQAETALELRPPPALAPAATAPSGEPSSKPEQTPQPV
ncbi:MAG: hypothetical protein WA634_11745, partial [Silvibacterium sp.]